MTTFSNLPGGFLSGDAFFLGNFADADSDESTTSLEDVSVYEQEFGSAGNPLHQDEVTISYFDANQDGIIQTNNTNGETLSYDIGNGAISSVLDSVANVDLIVTYVDGTTQAFPNAVIFQDASGNLFLQSSSVSGGSQQIESVAVNSADGSGQGGMDLNSSQGPVCYVAGTRILTSTGEVLVEDLVIGNLVVAQDHGLQPIRWIGDSTVQPSPKMISVRIRQGALGEGLPKRDLLVSQQHRILVRSRIVKRMTDKAEVFITAKKLVGAPGIDLDLKDGHVRYIHFMCDGHEIVFAEGAASESLLPGPNAMQMMGAEVRCELLEVFPDLYFDISRATPTRAVLKGLKQRKLIERHVKNHRKLVEGNAFFF